MTTLSADDVERMCAGGLAEAREEYGPQWPRDACSDTCSMIIHELSRGLRKEFPCAGGWKTAIRSGRFAPDLNNDRVFGDGHTWIVAAVRKTPYATGLIIDPTAGQFLPGQAVRVFTPDDPEWEFYR